MFRGIRSFSKSNILKHRYYNSTRFCTSGVNHDYPEDWYKRATKELKGKDPHNTLAYEKYVSLKTCTKNTPRKIHNNNNLYEKGIKI